jgi:hypothetical protein
MLRCILDVRRTTGMALMHGGKLCIGDEDGERDYMDSTFPLHLGLGYSQSTDSAR